MSSKPLPKIHLLDGGLGTTLQSSHSVIFDSSTPLWSSQLLLTSPSTLLAVQTAFVTSGADVLLTATYQASFEGFAASGVKDEVEAARYMRSGVDIARKAFLEGGRVDNGTTVLGLGAYGATMIPGQEYEGNYDEERKSVEGLRVWHNKRIAAFHPTASGDGSSEIEKEKRECWASVDMVAFETLPILKEVEAVRKVMYDVSKQVGEKEDKEFWVACVFPGEENKLPDGSTVQEVVKAMLKKEEGSKLPSGIGFNCTKIAKVKWLIEEFENAVEGMVESGEVEEYPSLVVYPDGTTHGEVYNTTTQEWEKKSDGSEGTQLSWDETLWNIKSEVRERGKWKSIYVGGCCKTTPVEIGKLRQRIDSK